VRLSGSTNRKYEGRREHQHNGGEHHDHRPARDQVADQIDTTQNSQNLSAGEKKHSDEDAGNYSFSAVFNIA